MAKVPIPDVDRFIELVKAHPALYDKADKSYKNLNVKQKLWSKVCNELLCNWSQLDAKTKLRIMHEVQQKWLNLRTCFSRDIATHRKAMQKDPVSAQKRHRYLHYKKLLFLLPPSEYAQALTPSVVEKDNEDERVEIEDDKIEFDDDMNGFEDADDVDNYIEEVPADVPQQPKTRNGVNGRYSSNQSMGAVNFNDDDDDDIVPIPDVSHQVENIDENVNFVLSLVPTLRSFSEEQQFDAKIEIMRVLKQFKLKR